MKELYKRNKSGIYAAETTDGVMQPSLSWVATEYVEGAGIRVTVRSGHAVRVEVKKRPSVEQRKSGIVDSWFREASTDVLSADRWLKEAVNNTSWHSVPDGEWFAVAVGPKILDNPYGLVGPRVVVPSLMPWSESLSSLAPVVPTLDRCPVDFNSLPVWLEGKKSFLNSSVQIRGIVWWCFDVPVAKVMTDGF